MGLDDLLDDVAPDRQERVRKRIERLENPELCPRCGKKGEKKEYYYRCTNDDCETVTYIPPKEHPGVSDLL